MGGADLAARLIGTPSEHNTSLGKVELAAEEEKDDIKEDEEGMELGGPLRNSPPQKIASNAIFRVASCL